jgi:hypothetical protein
MAGKKIGRNDKCPCGSGKKFKQCCIGKISKRAPQEPSKKKHPLSQFNRMFLIDTIGKAFTSPENHGKNIRLELIARESLIEGLPNEGSTDTDLLKKVLKKYYDHHYMEDPPEFLFTDIITFFGGDFIVLPGIFSNGHFVLSHLLLSLFFRENEVPDETKIAIHSRVLLLLCISNEIATRLNLSRYEVGQVEDNLIFISENYNNETFISDDLIEEWADFYKIESDSIYHFVLEQEANLKEDDPNLNPIVLKPIIRVNNGFKILSITSIIGTLLDSIFKELIESTSIESALRCYSEDTWNHSVEYHLRKMSISPVKIDFITSPDWVKLGVYKIDYDKIMLITFSQDSAEGFGKESNLFVSQKMVSIDDEFVGKTIESLNTFFPNHEYLIVHLTCGIGRQFGVSFDQSKNLTIGMSVIDFELIMRSREYDPLQLWNYAEAKESLSKTTKLTPFIDEIDTYALYNQKGNSFYINDEKKPDYLSILPGNSLSFREEIYLKEDIHSIRIFDENGVLGALICVKAPEYKKTYIPIGSSILRRVVITSKRPIWVEFDDINNVNIEHREIYINILEAISYWIWQVSDSLESHLNVLPELPIKINFDLRDRDAFENLIGRTQRDDSFLTDFVIETENQGFKIVIPETIDAYLYGSDNVGERVLLSKLLEGLGELQKLSVGSTSLNSDEINRLIDLHAPLGLKKKLFLIDMEAANDICLLPVGRSEPRYVQEFNVNVVLDQLVPRLVKKGVITGKPEIIKDQDSFLKSLLFDVLLGWLNDELLKHDSVDLIKRLYNNMEVLVHKRRMNFFTLPPAIACFQNYQEQLDKLINNEQDTAQTNVSVRCLIEHISAFPVNSGNIASQSDLDQLLAIMEQIVAWGMANDMVYFGLSKSKIEILPSSRVGTDHSFQSEVITPFRESHAKENIADSSDNFIRAFEKNIEKSEDNDDIGMIEFDVAFKKDYGITLTQILKFSNALIEMALTSEHHCEMKESELVKEIKLKLPELSNAELNSLLSYYSIEERKKFFIPPKGYENHDISPWRFNRGISLLKKPLVKIKGEETIYIWGARQVELASHEILGHLHSGKIRCHEKSALAEIKGYMLAKKGTEFTLEVRDFFKSREDDILLDLEVPMKIKRDKDLGDIDVLIINHSLKKIFLIECKKTGIAKNIKQLVEEVNHLFGSDHDQEDDGWVGKHKDRLDWILKNPDFLEKKYSIDLDEYQVHASIVTSEELATKFFKKDRLPFPMISFYTIKENKNPYQALLSL